MTIMALLCAAGCATGEDIDIASRRHALTDTGTGFYYPVDVSVAGDGNWLACGPDYYPDTRHIGTDISAAVDTPVYAVAQGTVRYISSGAWGPDNYGVLIEHQSSAAEGAFIALYGHIYGLGVGVDDTVSAGGQIGKVGPYSGGSHLHFGVHPGPWNGFQPTGGFPTSDWGSIADDNCDSPTATNGFVAPITYITVNCPGACGGGGGGCTPDCAAYACGATEPCGTTCGSYCDVGCTGHCTNLVMDCDETGTNCGGASCPPCGAGGGCGDGACSGGETCSSCPDDCLTCGGFCGDVLCDPSIGETCASCPFDCDCSPTTCSTDTDCPWGQACEWGVCVPAGGCGDGACAGGETCASCPGDCGSCSTCGDGACSAGETCASCPGDCGSCSTCGDGACSAGETCASCPGDCGSCSTCGDGTCSAGETCSTCALDCGPCSTCGNGVCSCGETCLTCPADCSSCSSYSCGWYCEDYGYAPGDCVDGWYCAWPCVLYGACGCA